jgi:hypothetical protein
MKLFYTLIRFYKYSCTEELLDREYTINNQVAIKSIIEFLFKFII